MGRAHWIDGNNAKVFDRRRNNSDKDDRETKELYSDVKHIQKKMKMGLCKELTLKPNMDVNCEGGESWLQIEKE